MRIIELDSGGKTEKQTYEELVLSPAKIWKVKKYIPRVIYPKTKLDAVRQITTLGCNSSYKTSHNYLYGREIVKKELDNEPIKDQNED